jgi:acetoin utilization protein AcuB
MEFFTAEDVLDYRTGEAPDHPLTVDRETTIQEALEIMLENDFDQLPVRSEEGIEGTITYKSVARFVKAMDDPAVAETSVEFAVNPNPEFVDPDHDIFQLLETFAADDFVLIGTRDNLEGIITRYDVFYFLEYQVKPFLQIGEIENALRSLIRKSVDDVDRCIQETFADRVEHDEGYDQPSDLNDFSFGDYRMVLMRNLEQFPEQISEDRSTVEDLLEETGEIRNALFHFRAGANEVDRDKLNLAHNYFT